MNKKYLIVLPVLLAISACSTPKIEREVIVRGVNLPVLTEQEKTCINAPDVPKPLPGEPRVRESALKTYIKDLYNASNDCRDKLEHLVRVWEKVAQEQNNTSRILPR